MLSRKVSRSVSFRSFLERSRGTAATNLERGRGTGQIVYAFSRLVSTGFPRPLAPESVLQTRVTSIRFLVGRDGEHEMQMDPQLGSRILMEGTPGFLTGAGAGAGSGSGSGKRGRGGGGGGVHTQTQWLGNGRCKEWWPFGAAANILTLAWGSQSSWGGCCALLARSHIARLLRDHVAKPPPPPQRQAPGGSAYGPPAASDTSLYASSFQRPASSVQCPA